jgi:hypothetical protein
MAQAGAAHVTALCSYAPRRVRENVGVGCGWGEIDRDVVTGYHQKILEDDPEILM